MARTVTDSAIMLNILVGYDPNDAATAWGVGNTAKDYTEFLKKDGLKGKHIGVLRSFFGTKDIHKDVNKVTNNAIEEMKGLGATVVELNNDLDSGKIASEISVHLYDLKPDLNSYLAEPDANTPVKCLAEVIASGKYHPGIEENIKQAQALDRDDQYRIRLQKRAKLQEQVMKMMADNQLDAIVYPHQKRLVVPIGGQIQVERNGSLGSVTGFPAIVVPGGFSTPDVNAEIGVPIGIEFLGRPWTEGNLIEIGYGYEQGTHHRQQPVATPALVGQC